MKTFTSIFILILACLSTSLFGQTGEYDVKLSGYAIDMTNMKYYIDINIKATSSSTTFNIAHQNYKFTYDETVIGNPHIEDELTIAGFVTTPAPNPTSSFYSAHTLTGSIDSILAYNVQLSGGNGFPIEETNWVTVGRVGFDILDINGLPELEWKSCSDFPATVLTERVNGIDYEMGCNNLNGLTDFEGPVVNAPIAVDDSYSVISGFSGQLDVITNDFDDEGIDTSNVWYINGTANGQLVNNNDGTFTYTSDPGFVGIDSFDYKVCDMGTPVLCDTAVVEINVQPNPANSDIIANNDFVEAFMDSLSIIDVLVNDGAASGEIDTTSLTITINPDFGTANIIDNKVEYLPNSGYYGKDEFTYQICAKANPSECETAWVRIDVNNLAGQYNLRVVVDSIDEINSKMYVIVEVKATDEENVFHISDQNYRLSFNRAAVENPFLVEELDLSGFVQQTGSTPTSSFYTTHTLTGSLDTVISYNIELAGGDGYLLSHLAYTQVGKLGFDIVDIEACYDVWWHTKDPLDFPATFVGKKWNGVLDSAGEGVYDAATGCFNENLTDVWPGDTDNNTVVSNYDVLNVGIALGATGTVRQNASTDWEAQPAADWGQSTPTSNVDYKHIDTDGDGQITLDDTVAINLNWAQSYNPANFTTLDGEIPFFIIDGPANPGTTIDVPIMLGDMDDPVEDAYGLAFTLNYDEDMVHPAEAQMLFDNSWLGNEGVDMFQLQKNFELDGLLEIGLSRMDGNAVSGHGQIGVLRLTIKDDVLIGLKEADLAISIENVRLQRQNEEEILTLSQEGIITITDSPLGTDETNDLEMSIRPNPVKDILYINTQEQSIDYFEIVNILGQVVFTQENLSRNLEVDVQNWVPGIYTVRAARGKAIFIEKILVTE